MRSKFDCVTAKVKVTKMGESDVVGLGAGKKKQEITVGDKMGMPG